MDLSPGLLQPEDQFKICQCILEILSKLGADITSTASDVCYEGDEERRGVACTPACLTDNSSCSLEKCDHDTNNQVDVCTMYQNNKTLDGLANNLHIIATNLDCKTISHHLKINCLNILCKNTTDSIYVLN